MSKSKIVFFKRAPYFFDRSIGLYVKGLDLRRISFCYQTGETSDMLTVPAEINTAGTKWLLKYLLMNNNDTLTHEYLLGTYNTKKPTK